MTPQGLAEQASPKFYCIDDGVPRETLHYLNRACEQRGVSFLHVQSGELDHTALPQLETGAMMYRPGTSMRSAVAEQLLYHPGVATFYTDPEGPWRVWSDPEQAFMRAGLPTPRMILSIARDRTRLRRYVEHLGGFPVVLKALGNSLGIGVMRLDSYESLFSVVDYIEGRADAVLMSYIAPATHWRVIVVGERAVASYRNVQDEDDFRTHVGPDKEDFLCEPPSPICTLAVRAVASQRLEFGGVDILEHESGRAYLLESNFPCYYVHPQEEAGVDVAGAMLEHLMSKAQRLRTSKQTP